MIKSDSTSLRKGRSSVDSLNGLMGCKTQTFPHLKANIKYNLANSEKYWFVFHSCTCMRGKTFLLISVLLFFKSKHVEVNLNPLQPTIVLFSTAISVMSVIMLLH